MVGDNVEEGTAAEELEKSRRGRKVAEEIEALIAPPSDPALLLAMLTSEIVTATASWKRRAPPLRAARVSEKFSARALKDTASALPTKKAPPDPPAKEVVIDEAPPLISTLSD